MHMYFHLIAFNLMWEYIYKIYSIFLGHLKVFIDLLKLFIYSSSLKEHKTMLHKFQKHSCKIVHSSCKILWQIFQTDTILFKNTINCTVISLFYHFVSFYYINKLIRKIIWHFMINCTLPAFVSTMLPWMYCLYV